MGYKEKMNIGVDKPRDIWGILSGLFGNVFLRGATARVGGGII